MTPYQRAAAVSAHPVPVHQMERHPWTARTDLAAQALLQAAMVLVLAAMAVTWMHVPLGSDPGQEAVRTWLADAVALAVLGAAGVLHSLVRRGRARRWPVAVGCSVLPAVVVLCPLLAA